MDTPSASTAVTPSSAKKAKRNVLACENCRKAKQRCVLGDDPAHLHGGRCQPCTRLRKAECIFPDARRKSRGDGEEDGAEKPGKRKRSEVDMGLSSDEHEDEDGVLAWSNYPMVAQGWCKATDASGYIISYYEHLDEMTPITIADYRDPKDHGRLIRDEPMLTTAILLISARFNNAPAAGTHAVLLNEKLAEQLQAQIKQVYWAGDIFGNDTSSGSMRLSLSPSSSERTLRSLGTIESLLLLMEWHHKSFHFPARDVLSRPLGMGSNANGTFSDWRQSIWKSNKMCWSLLSTAVSIAVEHGIFIKEDEFDAHITPPTLPELSYHLRKEKIRKLLYIYGNQLSARLDLTSIVPVTNRPLFSQEFIARAKSFTESNTTGDLSYDQEFRNDLLLWFWCRITWLAQRVTAALYPTRRFTKDLIEKGEHRAVMQQFEDELIDYHKRLDQCSSISRRMRMVLEIEFSYVRAYINQPALTAVVQKCLENNLPQDNAQTSQDQAREAIPGNVMLGLLGQDRPFVEDITQACQNLLYAVLDLHRTGGVKYASVRTYSRILMAACLLLTTFTCGATEADTLKSLDLFNKASKALQVDVVDDVHIGCHIGQMLEKLSVKIRADMVRVAGIGGNIGQSKQSDTRFTSQILQSQSSTDEAAQDLIDFSHGMNNQIGNFDPRLFNADPNVGYDMTYATPLASNMMYGTPSTTNFYPNPYNTWTPVMPPSHNTATNHLLGINDAAHYNPSDPQFSIMPPPFPANPAYQPGSDLQSSGMPADLDFIPQDNWIGFSLDNMRQQYWGQDVTQSGYGPEGAGMDVLEFMLGEGEREGEGGEGQGY